MLPLVGHQREPRPISWGEQRQLLPLLPDHLARMSLFILNTGVRDDVACSLRWEWEIPIPELGISVFEVPREHVKGRRRTRLVVCNSVAQSVIEACRGRHPSSCSSGAGNGSRTWTRRRPWPTGRSRR
jgi:integrase